MVAFQRHFPNALSLSRVPAAIAFLLAYSATDSTRFVVALSIGLAALATDFADGYLSRRWNVTSEVGYFLDGLGDKSFHCAVLLVMMREEASPAVLIWLLIIREIVLYALRTLDPQRSRNLKQLRAYSRYHAFFIRLYFGVFFAVDGLNVFDRPPVQILHFGDALGWVAAIVGYAAIAILVRNIDRET
jgi:CDP-diacylglycerol--glycerol-3-phosphate 3-phosphatidyltransferase